MEDTIVGISSSLGIGAISIIRMSGKESFEIVNKIFTQNILNVDSHTIHYGHIKENNKLIDEVLVSVMKAPKTYTREDIIEINCHGGIITTNKILELLIKNGARLAEPGEFTKRAFLNGRIDLIEAEAIMDLINSKSESARKLAINGLSGNVTLMIENLRNKISKILSNIEANIDYPEYEDILVMTKELIKKEIIIIEAEINKIIKESENSKIIKNGIDTVILGKPNVGKSSLLNKLIGEEKAIVTNIPGTTRDFVEGTIVIDSVLFNIFDTAGIRETHNKIEQIGVSKSINLINTSDVVILVFDNNRKIQKEDMQLLNLTKDKKRIIVINKIDLESKLDKKLLSGDIVEISALNNNIKPLKDKLIEMFNIDSINKKDPNYLFNTRQISTLKKTLNNILELKKGIKNNLPVDILEIDIMEIWKLLGEIIGKNYNEELVEEIFKNFCLGK
ncbi:MAG: tRNA uridine-5-carboxymethylaminomethyl(34) synthesis GTPase MnmE [Tenericutes bacterium]|nr:tRNA uridine-5-carboxymethylaminomethyl(34) synthesis GTPase MnmE [Bacilli bacterium]NLV89921.1 tRNA uridine-5-carboxymethylaminomethyl(34) synthesis GTPase MnmE [Mycoplasmatota bacterium]